MYGVDICVLCVSMYVWCGYMCIVCKYVCINMCVGVDIYIYVCVSMCVWCGYICVHGVDICVWCVSMYYWWFHTPHTDTRTLNTSHTTYDTSHQHTETRTQYRNSHNQLIIILPASTYRQILWDSQQTPTAKEISAQVSLAE